VSRAALLLDALEPAVREALAGQPDLEARIDAVLAAARAAWPAVTVADEVFVPYVARRLEARPTTLEQTRIDDLYLACACSRADAAGLREFERSAVTVVESALERLGVSPDLRGEIQQEIREEMFVAVTPGEPLGIEQYRGRGPLRAWVRVVAVRKALRAFSRRKRSPERGDPELLDVISASLEGPVTLLTKHAHRAEVERWIREGIEALDDRGRTVLRLQLVEGKKVEDIAKLHDVHPVTAARWLAQARAKLLDHVRKVARNDGKLDRSEADALVHDLRSQVELSLERIMK
jgi:RNA polymerase sigma-70 factor (ECF subfamily)